jgi:signal transduction histidine kinase
LDDAPRAGLGLPLVAVSGRFAPPFRRFDAAAVQRWAFDVLVAAAVTAATIKATLVIHHEGHVASRPAVVAPLGLALLAVAGAALVFRRRFPVIVLAITYAATVWYWVAAYPRGPVFFLADAVAFVTVVMARRRRAAVAALVAYYVGYQWIPVLAGTRASPSGHNGLVPAAALLCLLGGAEWLRLRRQRAIALAHSEAEEGMRRASQERLRMARDLHDVVAHNISVINVQANTALHLMERQPLAQGHERAHSALTTINDVSKQALVELRSVLGVLRGTDEGAPRTPSPGLARLDELVESSNAAGLTVRVERRGEPEPLPSDVDLAAYRIVQEALTNAARHSGGSSAAVSITYGGDHVVVQVDDDGPGRPARPWSRPQGTGSGIVGMTERAVSLGGTLEAGPRPGGGFRVRARLPVTDGAR